MQNSTNPEPLFDFLNEQKIPYQRMDHDPVYTVEESKKLNLGLEGGSKQVDLKKVPALVESSNLSFASPERLMKHLGILPGSVSLLALINDSDGQVEVLIDQDLWEEENILCHPLVNTSTLSLKREDLEHYINKTGHEFQLVQVPCQLPN